MSHAARANTLFQKYIVENSHQESDYFSLIRELVFLREKENDLSWQEYIDKAYTYLLDEIKSNVGEPSTPVKFGTSGWRGFLGKDVYLKSAAFVTAAIVEMYNNVDSDDTLHSLLGVSSFEDAKAMGCVVGFDNRFGGEMLAGGVVSTLRNAGIKVYYAGESTTGVLSAVLLELGAAFSINLTPSHNPLDYGGFKYNAFDGGPAEPALTGTITSNAHRIFAEGSSVWVDLDNIVLPQERNDLELIDSLQIWKNMVVKNKDVHGVNYTEVMAQFEKDDEIVIVLDSVHGASRLHIKDLFKKTASPRLIQLRDNSDTTFGGIAPEPSSINIQQVVDELNGRKEKLKLGAIIDPDADRIRFTDGTTEISMNQFGVMAYHFLHEMKGKKGLVAKTVATSNMANAVAKGLGEEVFEPKVGFKEFKPVIGRALVYFEESDGISIIGHTPEKDAYIGLLLALDMVLTRQQNLGDYLQEIEQQFGAYYPEKDGVEVSLKGEELLDALSELEKYTVGSSLNVGNTQKTIKEIISIDGRKFIFDDDSWLMIRPSGTEPKVRFYVESRDRSGTDDLVQTARQLLSEIGVL